jgi:hypothetical protein
MYVVSFCFHFNNQNPRVQTLKEGLTSVYYMHLSLHSSLIRPKVAIFTLYHDLYVFLLSFYLLVFLSMVLSQYVGYVCM